MTKTLEERAKIGAQRRADRESENYPYDSLDIFEAYQAGYEDAGEKELPAVLDESERLFRDWDPLCYAGFYKGQNEITAHSDWNELRELSDNDRGYQIYHYLKLIKYGCDYYTDINSNADIDLKAINKIQQHLDRIKALVMSKGKEW